MRSTITVPPIRKVNCTPVNARVGPTALRSASPAMRRSSDMPLSEAMLQDYVLLARVKGMSELRLIAGEAHVILQHRFAQRFLENADDDGSKRQRERERRHHHVGEDIAGEIK